MKNGLDIHNYPQKLEQAVACVERAKISLQNKQAILKFRDFCSLQGIGLPRTERRSFFCPNKLWVELKKQTNDCMSVSEYIKQAVVEKIERDNAKKIQ